MTRLPLSRALAAVLLVFLSCSARALPSDIEADRLVLAAEEKIAQQDFDGAKNYLERVTALKVEPRPAFYYLYGQVLLHEGDLEQADAQLTQYVTRVGREGENYDAALRMITQVEEQLQSQKDVSSSREQRPDLKAIGLDSGDSEGKAYDDKVRKLYLSASLKDALVMHINGLLKSYLYLEGKVKNLATSNRESYSLSVSGPSEILVTKTVVNHDQSNGQAEISVSKMNAFGISPFVTYRCSKAADNCVIKNPVNGQDWIRVGYDEAGAKEIATAQTRLIKALQR